MCRILSSKFIKLIIGIFFIFLTPKFVIASEYIPRGYFVIDLNNRKKDIRKFINVIEKSIIQFLNIYKIKAKNDKKNIGIWVNRKKIAAIGIRVSRWVAYHGFSININNNLQEYKKIIPCGLDNDKITSIQNEGKNFKNIEQNLKQTILKYVSSIWYY